MHFSVAVGCLLLHLVAPMMDQDEADAKRWCDYIGSTPAPNIVIYNRIPKCGSTTMQVLFNLHINPETKLTQNVVPQSLLDEFSRDGSQPEFIAKRQDYIAFSKNKPAITFHTGNHFWVSMEDNIARRHEFVNKINEIMKELNPTKKKTLFVDGHWHQTKFKVNKELHGYSSEYVQLIRNCQDREESAFFFFMYNVKPGSEMQKLSNRGREIYHLKSDKPVKDCIADYQCLKNSEKFDIIDQRNGYQSAGYLCGKRCSEDNGLSRDRETKRLNGSMRNIELPKTFSVVGVLEHLEEYLDMLECAYPVLRGIRAKYEVDKRVKNRGKHSGKRTRAMQQILDEVCNVSTNIYPMVNSSLTYHSFPTDSLTTNPLFTNLLTIHSSPTYATQSPLNHSPPNHSPSIHPRNHNSLYRQIYKKIVDVSLNRHKYIFANGGFKGKCCRKLNKKKRFNRS